VRYEVPKRFIQTTALALVVTAVTVPSFGQNVRVAGTNVTLAPPDGFAVASQYPGFQRAEAQASIMVTELPVAATEMMRSLSAPALASKGMTLITARDTVIADRPARLLHVRQTAPGGTVLKWMLIAGHTKTTMMIVGTYPEAGSQDLGDAIRRSVLTASWSSAAPAGPFDGLPFRLTPTPSLKLARRVSNMLMFTESGTTGAPGSTEALYIAGHSIGQAQIRDTRAFAEARAKETNLLTGVTAFTGRAIRIDGADAYELEADATDSRSGRPMRLYQTIVPDETGYFILQGVSRADRAAGIVPEFRKLTASFHRVSAP
jgi:hypothetical protein